MSSASPKTQETYRRDLREYVLPRFGGYRLGQLPPDEIENWLNDELESGLAASSVHRHYRTLRRMMQVAVEKQKILANPCDLVEPPRVPKREMTFLSWAPAIDLAEAHSERYRAMIYLAVDSGIRWSELVGLRRSRLDLRNREVRVTEQLVRLESGKWLRKEPKTGSSVRSITLSPFTEEVLEVASGAFRGRRAGCAGLCQRQWESPCGVELLEQPLLESGSSARDAVPLPRPMAHERGAGCGGRCPPEGHPNKDGSLVYHGDPRSLWPPLS